MATATDNFSASGVLTTPWTNQQASFTSNGTTCSPTSLGSDAAAVYNGSPLNVVGADQYAQVEKGTWTGGSAGSEEGVGVSVRWAAAATTGYRAIVSSAATLNVTLHRIIAGAGTKVGQVTQAFAAGDRLRISVTGQNTSTVVLVERAAAASPTVFSTLITYTDNSGSAINSGFPGLAYSSTLTAASVDNWEGGDLVGVTFEQEGYRWRADDGSETTATWLATQDTNITRAPGLNTRLRALVDSTGGDPNAEPLKLEYRKVGNNAWRRVGEDS